MTASLRRPTASAAPATPPEAGTDARLGPREVLAVEAGREIYGQGEVATAIYRVDRGVVRIYRLLSDGRRQISAFCLPGEVFGFEADERHHFFAEAIGPAVVKLFRRPLDAAASAALLPEALKALVRAQEHLLVIGRQSAAERLAGFLLDMQARQGGVAQIELPSTREDIGDYLGLTVETVSRCISKFRARGLIRLHGARCIQILDLPALSRLSA